MLKRDSIGRTGRAMGTQTKTLKKDKVFEFTNLVCGNQIAEP